jgi:hypothetical protein
MGKTALALNIAINVAKQNKSVAVFSLEMSKEQLVERLLSGEAYVPSDRLRCGMIEHEQWEALAVKTDELARLPIYLDDTGSTTVSDVKARVRRQRGVSFIIIDYLQLMHGDRRSENRVQEVSEMTRSLKIMAKELNIPVLVLSQLSRQNERRGEDFKRPMLSDLRDSGSIEQDADIVLFLYREVMYNPSTEEPGIAECIVSKNRHGTTGTVRLGGMVNTQNSETWSRDTMKTSFRDSVCKTIEKYAMLNNGDHITVALSGGADSVAMLLVLLQAAPNRQWTIDAVHVNHGLRGAESDRDEQYCRTLCQDLGVRFLLKGLMLKPIAGSIRSLPQKWPPAICVTRPWKVCPRGKSLQRTPCQTVSKRCCSTCHAERDWTECAAYRPCAGASFVRS